MHIAKVYVVLLGVVFLMVLSVSYMWYHNMNSNDVALKVLSAIKKIQGNDVSIDRIGTAVTPVVNHDIWNELLTKHVNGKGGVDYQGMIRDTIRLEQYLDLISAHEPGSNWSTEERLSYWINAYNAFTVKLILDNYPLRSIKEISDGLPMINSPWDIKFFQIGNVRFDLNTVEHDILRATFEEPRIHFAINCASVSCPPLRNEAYTPEKIYEQLEAQATIFINDTTRNIINNRETRLSRIFDWFHSDFARAGSLENYVARYNAALDPSHKIEYMDYNWNLNE